MEEKKRMHSLDVLKGLCILFIIATHNEFAPEERAMLGFPFWIDMAVPIFMIISGYVNAMSYERKGIKALSEMYSLEDTLGKLVRFTVPFAMAFVFEVVLYLFFMLMPIGFKHDLQLFETGGFGPGNYYFPIMIQFVFLFPLLYKLIKRYDFRGLVITFFATYIFELTKIAFDMSVNNYCYNVLRYMPMIALGIYAAVSPKTIRPWVHVASCAIGIAYTVYTYYLGHELYPFNYWSTTCFVACMFIMPLIYLWLKHVEFRFPPLELLGKASYNIFLAQMVFYFGAVPLWYNHMGGKAGRLIGAYIICLVGGVIFYFIEQPITKAVRKLAYSIYHAIKDKRDELYSGFVK